LSAIEIQLATFDAAAAKLGAASCLLWVAKDPLLLSFGLLVFCLRPVGNERWVMGFDA
jgi:hypothetical protein